MSTVIYTLGWGTLGGLAASLVWYAFVAVRAIVRAVQRTERIAYLERSIDGGKWGYPGLKREVDRIQRDISALMSAAAVTRAELDRIKKRLDGDGKDAA